MYQKISRRIGSLFLALAIALAGFSTALAAPPAHDNFASAEVIASLPLNATVDITETTNEPGEPQYCTFMPNTVWYSFTPTESTALRADMVGSAITGNVNIYLSSGPGFSDLSILGCASFSGSFSFSAEAGKTYFLQAGSYQGEVGSVQINLQQIFPPANDNFASAEAIASLPFNATVGITNALTQPGEPQNCVYMQNTVWYSFTPTETTALRADTLGGAISSMVNVYLASGPGISDLSFLGCSIFSGGSSFSFYAEAGTTYYLQAGSTPDGGIGNIQINLEQIFPPANDNFADAEAVASLPFTATVGITNAMTEPGEPQQCTSMPNTVWYSFTPTETTALRADTLGGAIITGQVNVYLASGPGISDLSFLACSIFSGSSFSFYAEAGNTYYLQIGSYQGEVGNIQINLTQIFPPANDNFADAEAIDSLPFTATVDTTDATYESGEPQVCYNMVRTIWYSFSPTEDMVVRANTQGSAVSGSVNIYHATGPGMSDLQHLSCSDPENSSTFIAEAGETYYLQVGGINGEFGNIQVNLEQVPPPANDDFASAASIDSFPSITDFTNIGATMESGEPTPSCAYTSPPFSTIWFSFTPAQAETILANLPNNSFNAFWAVYSGTSLNNLTELGCRNYGTLFWHAIAGQTYYIQIGGLFAESGSGILSLETTSPPQANFYFSPSDPSKFDTIQFYDYSNDPSGIGIETWEWDFGDGTPHSTNPNPTHMYRVDGNYDVTLTVTTFDGRTASLTQTISLGSHDVTITKVDSPDSGRVGRTQRITVTVSNIKASPETVTVNLYKSVPNGGFEYVASLTLPVPASTRGRVTKFVFQYTFTSADAQIGKMIFRALANIDGLRDSFPQDNERLSLITTLRRPISYP